VNLKELCGYVNRTFNVDFSTYAGGTEETLGKAQNTYDLNKSSSGLQPGVPSSWRPAERHYQPSNVDVAQE
jgi:hypothetical protein